MIKSLNDNQYESKYKIKNKVKFAQAATIAGLCALTGVMALLQNFTFAVSVSYEDKEIGLVQAESSVETATQLVKQKVVSKDEEKKESIKIQPITSVVLTKKENIISEQELADNIIDTSSEVVKGEALYVDGDLYAAVDKEADLDKTLDNILDEHKTGQEQEQVKFAEDVQVVQGVFLSDEVVDEQTLENKVKEQNPISVSKSYEESKLEQIPFDVEIVESDEYVEGTQIVEQIGSNGLVEYKEKVVTIDDDEKNRTVVKQDVLKQPTKQRVIVGTASITNENAILVDENGDSFTLPLKQSYVSSPYGNRDGSSHKGVDLCVRGGTLGKPVVSTAKGVVEEVLQTEESGGYGIKVTVNHGNNTKSVYAHLDSVDVKEGQVLDNGQQIGTAGNTGDSYGAHLHFELYINGQRVDPMLFVKDTDQNNNSEEVNTIK